MAEVIPAILAKDATDLEKKLRAVEGAVATVQIDCMDNTFVPYSDFFDADAVRRITLPLRYELHLMVSDPKKYIVEWKNVVGFQRAIFHAEIQEDLKALAHWIRNQGIEPSVAINPETPIERVIPLLPMLESAMVMGVVPGQSGQPLLPGTLERIRALRKAAPHMPISVDGGVTAENARELVAAGATRLAAASAIFNSPDPRATIAAFASL